MSDLGSYQQLKDQIWRWRHHSYSIQGRVWRRVILPITHGTVPFRVRVGILCCMLLITVLALLESITSVGTHRETPSQVSLPTMVVFPNRVITEERSEYSTGIFIDVGPSTIIMNNVVSTTDKAIPDCDDVTGKHLNYDTATHVFLCGTTSSP